MIHTRSRPLLTRCLRPIKLENPNFNYEENISEYNPRYIFVPCGKCEICLSVKRKMWFFRLSQELKEARSAYFVTLTYDNEHLPLDGRVCKSDVQLFFKRFRKSISLFSNEKIRYFLVSEYGEKFGRPHYHMLLFNFPGTREMLVSTLKKCWGLSSPLQFDIPGSIGRVEPSSINYVCKYCLSTINDESKKNFMLCSKGIGRSFLTSSMSNYLRSKLDGIGILNSVRYPLPRYYSDKVYTDEEKRLVSIKKFKYYEQTLDKYYNNNKNSLGGRPINLWFQEREQIVNSIRKRIKNG